MMENSRCLKLFCLFVVLFVLLGLSEGNVRRTMNTTPKKKQANTGVCPANHTHLKHIMNRLVCAPNCPVGCNGGKCQANGKCTCNKGFKPGLQGRQCQPMCQNCPNGFCNKPNVCTCKPGFRKNQKGRCVSLCPVGCPKNAMCVLGKGCHCKEGFKATLDGDCVPKCACTNGKCTAPGKCECNKGFMKNAKGDCEKPAAAKGGGGKGGGGKGGSGSTSSSSATANANANVHIIIDDRRTTVDDCPAGHSKYGTECVPACRRCSNGRCTAPDVCTCDEGYLYDTYELSCYPKCATPCANGVCTAPNQCTCRTGFVKDTVDPNICIPNCPQPCLNGRCIGNNECVCNQGFKKAADGHDCERDPTVVLEEDPLEKWASLAEEGDVYDIDVRMGL